MIATRMMQAAAGRGGIVYLLRDEFTADEAAPKASPAAAEPGPGTRTLTQTDGQFSSSAGRLVFPAQASPTWGDLSIRYGAVTRAAGVMFAASVNLSTYSNLGIGFGRTTTPGSPSTWFDIGLDVSTGALLARYVGTQIAIGPTLVTGTTYTFFIVLSATGGYSFIQGGVYTYPTLIWIITTNNTSTLYPAMVNFSSVGSADDFIVPQDTWLPTPLAYDTFTRSDGALGNTETTGPDAQAVAARAWTDQVGTWGVATNKAQAAALSGGIAQATAAGVSADVVAQVGVTRSGGVGGLTLRYTDANNYLRATHNGTNCLLEQVVSGTPTTLRTAAATYSAGALIRVILQGTTGWLFYNGASVGASFTVPSSAATAHGLYTSDTSNTLDNFLVMARGTGGEYV